VFCRAPERAKQNMLGEVMPQSQGFAECSPRPSKPFTSCAVPPYSFGTMRSECDFSKARPNPSASRLMRRPSGTSTRAHLAIALLMIDNVATYFGYRKEPRVIGANGEVHDRGISGDAWRAVGCDLGADCGPHSRFLGALCWVEGICVSSFDEYPQHHRYSPADYQRLQHLRQAITTAIATRHLASIGLASREPAKHQKWPRPYITQGIGVNSAGMLTHGVNSPRELTMEKAHNLVKWWPAIAEQSPRMIGGAALRV
jgi:hypothetical protein